MRVDREPVSNVIMMSVAVKCCCPEQVAGFIVVNAGCKLHGWGSGVAERRGPNPKVTVNGHRKGEP
jgi:hypothetical protein